MYHVLRSAKKIVSYHINFVKGGILTSKEFDIVKILNKLLKKIIILNFGIEPDFFSNNRTRYFVIFFTKSECKCVKLYVLHVVV